MMNSDDFTTALLASFGMILIVIVLTQFISCAKQDITSQSIERCARQFQENRTEMTAEEIQLILSSCQEAFSSKN